MWRISSFFPFNLRHITTTQYRQLLMNYLRRAKKYLGCFGVDRVSGETDVHR